MRITPLTADVNVSPSYPAQGIPAAAFQSGYAQAGIEIARGSEDIGRILQHKQHQDAQAEGLLMQSQAELALQKDDAARKAGATDGPEYYAGRVQAFKDVMEQVGGTAKNPGARAAFQAHMARAIVPIHGHALNHADKLTKDAEIAQMTTTIENYRTLLNGTDPFDKEAVTAIQGKITAAVMVRANALGGVDKATTMAISETHKTLEQVAARHEAVAPADFLKSVDRYQGMDGKALDRLQISAAERIDAADKTNVETANKFYELQMKDIEEERKQKLIWADEMAKNRLLTSDHLRVLRNTRTFKTTEEYDHLDAIIRNPPEQPSNKDFLLAVAANVRSLTPTYTTEQIRGFIARGDINMKDGMPLIDRLREHGERVEDKAYQKRGVDYHAAMDEGRRRLGITSTFESLDPLTKKLDSAFTDEMNSRTDWLNDKGESSRKILYEIMPRYLDAQKTDTRMNYDLQMGLIPKDIVGPAPVREIGGSGKIDEDKWQAWYSGAANRVEALKTKDPILYNRSRIQLQELQKSRQRMLDNAVRSEEFRSSGGGSATGRTPVGR